MKKLQKWCLALLAALLLTVPAAAAQYASAYDLFAAWEQNGYPDFVAGVYSIDGGPELAIQLVSGAEELADALQEMVDAPLTIEFGAAYSYNELDRVCNEIVEQYMGGGDVFSCGIGWTSSENGEIIGFGESGKEFRVTVGVKTECAQEYADLFYEKYGGAIVVESGGAIVAESGEGIAVDATAVREELALETGPTGGWNVGYVLLMLLVLVLAAASLWLRHRKRPVLQTADGQTETAERVSRRGIRDAVRRSEVAPERGFEDLKKKL